MNKEFNHCFSAVEKQYVVVNWKLDGGLVGYVTSIQGK